MWHKVTITAVAFSALMFTTSAFAQAVCGDRSNIVDQLSGRYKERPAAVGVVSNGSILEVLTSDKGTWTILITQPGGITCMMSSGDSWEAMPKLTMGPAA